MLPKDLLTLTTHERVTTPRYLTARDEAWVVIVIAEVATWVGRTLGERARGLRERGPVLASELGVTQRLLDGLLHVLTRTYPSEVASRVDPIEVRAVLFAEAAMGPKLDREGVLARSAQRLGLQTSEIESGLFADRERARRILAPIVPSSVGEVIDAFNLALVQGLLACSSRVRIEIEGDAGEVIRFAKRVGLLCTWTGDGERTRLDVSGPLTILRHTTKYSHVLARFFPTLMLRPHLRIDARCLVRDEEVNVLVTSADPVCRHVVPPQSDDAWLDSLSRAIDRLGTGWSVVPEGEVPSLTIDHPDLVLRRGHTLVLVEMVRFHTAEHLRRRLAKMPRDGPKVLVCLDESLAGDLGGMTGTFHRFRRKIDAARLLNDVDALVGSSGGGSTLHAT